MLFCLEIEAQKSGLVDGAEQFMRRVRATSRRGRTRLSSAVSAVHIALSRRGNDGARDTFATLRRTASVASLRARESERENHGLREFSPGTACLVSCARLASAAATATREREPGAPARDILETACFRYNT